MIRAENVSLIVSVCFSLQCLFCEKLFKDRRALKDHMRKKQHKKINPKNKEYDRFYVINYLVSSISLSFRRIKSYKTAHPIHTRLICLVNMYFIPSKDIIGQFFVSYNLVNMMTFRMKKFYGNWVNITGGIQCERPWCSICTELHLFLVLMLMLVLNFEVGQNPLLQVLFLFNCVKV